jgi:hypothetical protein
MRAVYGNMLDAFQELMEPVDFWLADVETGGLYSDPYNKHTINCIILEDKGDNIYKLNVLKGDRAQMMNNHDMLFAYSNTDIKAGYFLMHPDKEVHRVVGQLDFATPGGYSAWAIERVQGNNGLNEKPLQFAEPVF